MEKTYKIGEVAEIKNIDRQTLRYYDKLGILIPAIIDEETGYRYYTLEQFIDVDRIKFCKRIGLSLEETKDFMDGTSLTGALEVLRRKREAFADELRRIETIHTDLVHIVDSLETSIMTIDKRGFDEIWIDEHVEFYGIKGTPSGDGNLYDFELELSDLNRRHPKYSEIGHNFGITTEFNFEKLIPNEPVKAASIILRVDKSLKDDSEVRAFDLGRCVVTYHKGKRYGRLMKESICHYVEEHKLRTKGKIYVVPIANRFIVNEHSKHIYEILIPVE